MSKFIRMGVVALAMGAFMAPFFVLANVDHRDSYRHRPYHHRFYRDRDMRPHRQYHRDPHRHYRHWNMDRHRNYRNYSY